MTDTDPRPRVRLFAEGATEHEGVRAMTREGTTFEEVLLALGFAAGGLTRPALFTALAESLQNQQGLAPGHIVFLRDTLTRALQLAGVEPLGERGGQE
jgi:hypothetical protein